MEADIDRRQPSMSSLALDAVPGACLETDLQPIELLIRDSLETASTSRSFCSAPSIRGSARPTGSTRPSSGVTAATQPLPTLHAAIKSVTARFHGSNKKHKRKNSPQSGQIILTPLPCRERPAEMSCEEGADPLFSVLGCCLIVFEPVVEIADAASQLSDIEIMMDPRINDQIDRCAIWASMSDHFTAPLNGACFIRLANQYQGRRGHRCCCRWDVTSGIKGNCGAKAITEILVLPNGD